jgi:hypothetical protein
MRRTSRITAIAIPLIAVLVGLTVYEHVYLRVRSDLKTLKEERTAKARTLKKCMALIAEQPQLETRLARLKEQRKADETKLLSGNTPALAAASLQEAVKSIVTGRGGTISSERVEKPEEAGAFRIVSTTLDCVLPDIRSLNDMLYAIETRTPYLAVREVDARIKNFKEPKELTVKLKISGLMASK